MQNKIILFDKEIVALSILNHLLIEVDGSDLTLVCSPLFGPCGTSFLYVFLIMCYFSHRLKIFKILFSLLVRFPFSRCKYSENHRHSKTSFSYHSFIHFLTIFARQGTSAFLFFEPILDTILWLIQL